MLHFHHPPEERPRSGQRSQLQRPLLLGLGLTLAACGSSGPDTPVAAAASPGCDPAGSTVVIAETGAQPTAAALGLIDKAVRSALERGGSLRLLKLDGRDANQADEVVLPHLDPEGCLDTPAVNSFARREALNRALPEIHQAAEEVFAEPASLDDGRDLTGAISRAGRYNPAEIVVVSTSGGVQRSTGADFLREIPAAVPLTVPDGTQLTIVGIGRVPMPAGTTNKALTDRLLAAWHAGCDPQPNCRMVP